MNYISKSGCLCSRLKSDQDVKENLLGVGVRGGERILEKSLGLPLLFCPSKDSILELLQPSPCDHWGAVVRGEGKKIGEIPTQGHVIVELLNQPSTSDVPL